MKILTFAGSLRKGSLNKKVSHFVKNHLEQNKLAEVKFLDLQPLQIPVYDGDIEESNGLPPGVQTLCAEIQAADAIIISTPEYNGSIPGVLKNTIDWISRQKPKNPLAGKHILLMAASPGALGGVRSLWHSRQPFEVLGCFVHPEMMGFPKAHEVLNEKNEITDEKLKKNAERLIGEFISYLEIKNKQKEISL